MCETKNLSWKVSWRNVNNYALYVFLSKYCVRLTYFPVRKKTISHGGVSFLLGPVHTSHSALSNSTGILDLK